MNNMDYIFHIINKAKNKISLKESERTSLRQDFINHIQKDSNSQISLPSPYYRYSIRLKNFAGKSLIIAIIFLLTGGAGVVRAASNSLPGDSLYSMKVDVIEEVQGLLIARNENRINWEIERTERRLNEATTLAKEGNLDQSKSDLIVSKIEQHTTTINKKTDEEENNPDLKQQTHQKLESSLRAHEVVLKVVTNDSVDGQNIVNITNKKAEEANEKQEEVVEDIIAQYTPDSDETVNAIKTKNAKEKTQNDYQLLRNEIDLLVYKIQSIIPESNTENEFIKKPLEQTEQSASIQTKTEEDINTNQTIFEEILSEYNNITTSYQQIVNIIESSIYGEAIPLIQDLRQDVEAVNILIDIYESSQEEPSNKSNKQKDEDQLSDEVTTPDTETTEEDAPTQTTTPPEKELEESINIEKTDDKEARTPTPSPEEETEPANNDIEKIAD